MTESSAKKAEEPAEEIPEVDEATVGQLSEEVCFPPSHTATSPISAHH